jgi:uroporphyrinogen-III synthase
MTDKKRLSVLVTRPRGEAEIFAVALAMRGHDAVLAPLLDIVLDETARVDMGGVRAVLFTSANGVRAWTRVGAPHESEAFCVGDATAQAAREAGFPTVHSAGGDVAALAELVRAKLSPADGALLHAAGSALAGDLAGDLGKDGYEVRRVQLYRQDVATTLPFAAVQALREGKPKPSCAWPSRPSCSMRSKAPMRSLCRTRPSTWRAKKAQAGNPNARPPSPPRPPCSTRWTS